MKKRNLKKRLLAFLLCVAAAASLGGCQTGDGENKTGEAVTPSVSKTEETAQAAPPEPGTGAQEFINLLPYPDASVLADAVPPQGDLLLEINAANMQNADVVGWLSVPGTDINAEVLQAEDNAFYERSDITKSYNWYGCYYADYECAMGDRRALSKNTIIYGHNMKDDPNDVRFAQLIRYLDEDFAKSHPYIHFTTPEDEMVFEIFAVSYVDKFMPYVYPNRNGKQFLDLVEDMRDRSIYDYDVDVNINDKILTLSTCTYKYGKKNDQQRFLVVGRLLRPGETADAQTVGLTANPDPKQPEFREAASSSQAA